MESIIIRANAGQQGYNSVMLRSETHQQLKSNKNVTVNPWSAIKVNQIASGMLPPINSSSKPVINKTFTTEDFTDPTN